MLGSLDIAKAMDYSMLINGTADILRFHSKIHDGFAEYDEEQMMIIQTIPID